MSPPDEPSPGPDGGSHDNKRTSVRVLVVDDHAGVRIGVIRLLSTDEDFEVVGEAADGVEALELSSRLSPDLVLMDISMPVLDGVAATPQIAALPNPPAIVLFTAWTDRDRIAEALDSGASGCLLKDAPPFELFRSLRAALAAPRPRPRPHPIFAIKGIDGGAEDAVGFRVPEDPAPVVLFGSSSTSHRWQARVAGGAVAVLVLGSAGVVAAREGKLPAPLQQAARRVGLPTPTTKLEEARRALTLLDTALLTHDRATVAAADDALRRRLSQLSASDQTRLHASSVLSLAEQRLAAPGPFAGPVALSPDLHGGVSGPGGPGPGATSGDGGSPLPTVPDASGRNGGPGASPSPGGPGGGGSTSSSTMPTGSGGPGPSGGQ